MIFFSGQILLVTEFAQGGNQNAEGRKRAKKTSALGDDRSQAAGDPLRSHGKPDTALRKQQISVCGAVPYSLLQGTGFPSRWVKAFTGGRRNASPTYRFIPSRFRPDGTGAAFPDRSGHPAFGHRPQPEQPFFLPQCRRPFQPALPEQKDFRR